MPKEIKVTDEGIFDLNNPVQAMAYEQYLQRQARSDENAQMLQRRIDQEWQPHDLYSESGKYTATQVKDVLGNSVTGASGNSTHQTEKAVIGRESSSKPKK